MTILGVIIAALFEQQKFFIGKIRGYVHELLLTYVKFIINREFKNQREIRLSYLVAITPIALVLILLKILLFKYSFLVLLINLIIFVIFVQVLTWKEEAKTITNGNKNFGFIHTFAIKFFAPLVWFWVLPFGIGLIIYLVIMLMSQELKNKGLDLVVYNVVVDKMMFYANVIPYTILYIFIAFAGDFEHVSHYLIGQRKNFVKSFYFLESTLNDAILIAIDKDKYEDNVNSTDEDADSGITKNEQFSVQMVKYLVAVLYRAGLFALAVIILFTVARIFGLVA